MTRCSFIINDVITEIHEAVSDFHLVGYSFDITYKTLRILIKYTNRKGLKQIIERHEKVEKIIGKYYNYNFTSCRIVPLEDKVLGMEIVFTFVEEKIGVKKHDEI